MSQRYQVFETLEQHRAKLHDTVQLDSGVRLAAWSNKFDCVTQENPEHHTLSLYVADGYECYHKRGAGWHNGGAPDRFCIMPRHSLSSWDVRNDLSFVHMYCTDQHLRTLAESIWDRSPTSIQVDERVFAEDPRITSLYRHFLLNYQWQESANQLELTSATNLLMTVMLKDYTQLQWQLPQVRGGLSPQVLRRIKEYMASHIAEPLALETLAEYAGLSAYHFARMFKQSTGLAPHQYLVQQRLQLAEQLLRNSTLSLSQIALDCGFSSASHFSHRFKSAFGYAPSQLRQE